MKHLTVPALALAIALLAPTPPAAALEYPQALKDSVESELKCLHHFLEEMAKIIKAVETKKQRVSPQARKSYREGKQHNQQAKAHYKKGHVKLAYQSCRQAKIALGPAIDEVLKLKNPARVRGAIAANMACAAKRVKGVGQLVKGPMPASATADWNAGKAAYDQGKLLFKQGKLAPAFRSLEECLRRMDKVLRAMAKEEKKDKTK